MEVELLSHAFLAIIYHIEIINISRDFRNSEKPSLRRYLQQPGKIQILILSRQS